MALIKQNSLTGIPEKKLRFRDNYRQFWSYFQICEIYKQSISKIFFNEAEKLQRKKFLFNILHLKRKSKYVIVFYILKGISLIHLKKDKYFEKLAASMNFLHISSLILKQRKVRCTSQSQTIIAKKFFLKAISYLESLNWTSLLIHRIFKNVSTSFDCMI